MRAALRPLSILVAAALGAGCGNSTGGSATGPGTPLEIAGTWSLTAHITNPTLAASCESQGTAAIGQSGGALSGTANRVDDCTIGASHPADTVAAPIDSGAVSGATASFRIGTCSYVGSITGTPTDQMGGSTTCVLTFSGTRDTLVGTWHASR